MQQTTVRRFWLGLWVLALAVMFLPLFVSLRDRPHAADALAHFTPGWLDLGRRFSQEARLAATARTLLSLGLLAWLCFSQTGSRWLAWLEGVGGGGKPEGRPRAAAGAVGVSAAPGAPHPWPGLLAVGAAVSLLTALAELPFDFYLGYVHEKAYGLSRQTPAGWLSDHLLSFAIGMAISLAGALLLYAVIRRWPRAWWAPGALLQFVATGALIMAAPVVLMPLFDQIVPVRDPAVTAMVQRLADRAGVKVESVQEMLVSEKSARLNAMVTGLGPTKQVILFDTLLLQMNPAEVEVVLAHELAHAAHGDVVRGWLLSGLAGTATLALAAWMLQATVGVGPLNLPTPHAARGLALLLLLLSLAGHAAAPLENAFTRQMERRADRFALEVTGNPQAFIGAFRKLAGENPGDVDPAPLVEWMTHSHPSLMNRMRAAVPPHRQ